jgi:transketolase
VAVEAGITLGWQKYVGLDGTVIGRDGFGGSAPFKELYKHFGIITDAVYAAAKTLLNR